jgi:hypothetical protein
LSEEESDPQADSPTTNPPATNSAAAVLAALKRDIFELAFHSFRSLMAKADPARCAACRFAQDDRVAPVTLAGPS